MPDSRPPTKEYHARLYVKLTDDLLPQPMLSAAELHAHLNETLRVGAADSPIVSVAVEDPRTTRPRRY